MPNVDKHYMVFCGKSQLILNKDEFLFLQHPFWYNHSAVHRLESKLSKCILQVWNIINHFTWGTFQKYCLWKGNDENVKLSTAKHHILWILVTKNINKLVQWQLSPGRILYQCEIVYYGIVTSLLQQNAFYPSALRAGGVLSSRSGRAGGGAAGRAAAKLAEPISL